MILPPPQLEKSRSWNNKIDEMTEKYGINRSEIYDIIYGETYPKWNFASFNRDTKAVGAFQFIPSTLNFINKRYRMGVRTEDVLHMPPAQQLELYDRYLGAWQYDGSIALGFMQAAPGMFYRLKRSGVPLSVETVVYGTDTRAWRLNPGWRSHNNGPATIGSINKYYQKKV